MRKSKVLLSLIGLGVVGSLVLVAWATQETEEQVTLDQVPAAVKDTILKEAAGAKITEIERETKNGKTVYEAEFLVNGKEIEISVAADGTLLGRETEDEDEDEADDDVTIDQFPEPARAALLKLAGGAKITETECEKEDGVLVYEAEWTADGVQHEAAVTADGTLVETDEVIPVEKAPAAVRAAIAKHFGDAKVVVEKKMIVVYEVEARIDGKEKEMAVSPTGRVHQDRNDDDDDDGDDDHEDDDDDD